MVSFYDIIQAYFTQMTGRFVMFSGRDMALLHAWRKQGATPASVCRGIREAVLHMAHDQPPRSIYNCRRFIEPHVERARQRLLEGLTPEQDPALLPGADARDDARDDALGAPTPGPSKLAHSAQGALRQAMRALEQAGQRCQDEAVRALYREMWYRLRALEPHQVDVEAQYEHLLHLEEALAQSYYAALSMAEQRQIDELLGQEESELGLSVRMSPEAWQRHRVARKSRVLTRHYGMVSLLD